MDGLPRRFEIFSRVTEPTNNVFTRERSHRLLGATLIRLLTVTTVGRIEPAGE